MSWRDGVRAAGHSSAFLYSLFEQEKARVHLPHAPSRLTRLLGQHEESVATTYHAKLFVTNDTY